MFNNKKIALFFLSLAFLLFLSQSIQLSLSYKDNQNYLKKIQILVSLDKLFTAIENEKIQTSIYLGKKNSNILKSLERLQNKTDERMTKLFKLFDDEYLQNKQIADKVSLHLKEVRTEADSGSIAYKKILLTLYDAEIINVISHMMSEILGTLPQEYSISLENYDELINAKVNLGAETAFISYILSSSKKMDLEDLQIWTDLIGYEISPSFLDIDQIEVSSKKISYEKVKNDIRIKIYEGSLKGKNKKGKYKISIEEWIETSTLKVEKLEKAQEVLLLQSEKSLNFQTDKLKKDIFSYVLLSTIFLFLILFIVYLIFSMKRQRREVASTLKEIEEGLSAKQQVEIQEVLKKNDTVEIYKFLAKTIKEPNMAKDQFLANMSHEIRTPLNGILGFTSILQATEMTEEQKEFVEIIEESSKNLLVIVNDILDFSKISSGQLELEVISFEIIEKIEATIESYSQKVNEKSIELGLYIDPNLPSYLFGDSMRIAQVMLNLLGNAVKFTPERGQINVSVTLLSVSESRASIRFAVKDSGIGIEQSKQDQIFDAFTQADLSTNRKFGGTGLGLSISRKFVELMGGTLELESRKDVGSIFYFDLDLEIDKEEKPIESPNFSMLKIAYLSSGENIYQEIDDNIKFYVEYTQAGYMICSETELFSLEEEALPDLLFVNHRYVHDENTFSKILALKTKIVLISNLNISDFSQREKRQIYKLIHKPINFSKVMRVLDSAMEKELNNVLMYKESSLSGKIYYSILKSLGYEVDIYYSIEEFKYQLDFKPYRFALFDDKNTNNEATVELIKKNGAIPFLFSEKEGNDTYCKVLDYSIDAYDLKEQLKEAQGL